MFRFEGGIGRTMTQSLAFAVLGGGLGVLAWAQHSSPALALLLPLLWVMAPGRTQAFALTLAYHLAVVRFLPPYAGTWFDSLALGILIWFSLGVACALAWTLFWPSKTRPWVTVAAIYAALLATLLSPLAAVLPGHPIVGLGFLWFGGGWFAVAAFFVVIPALGYALVHEIPKRWPQRQTHPWLALIFIGALVGTIGGRLDGTDSSRGRAVGRMGAIHTAWGGFPGQDTEAIERVEKIGKSLKLLAGGVDGFDTVVFPESIIGWYEPGIHAVIKSEILQTAKRNGQTIILGADTQVRPGQFQNIAIVFRPDGSSSYISARQTTPATQWNPLNKNIHFPVDWLGVSTTNVGSGVTARIMMCHEEFMPILHLLSEARENQQLVIAIANRWASRNELASTVQSAHTEGMARLFGRRWLRAENGPKPVSK